MIASSGQAITNSQGDLVRGKANRLPDMKEVKYVEAWAERNGLKMNSYEVRRARRG